MDEAWLQGAIDGVDPVISHLLRATEQIREDAQSAIGDLTPAQIWSKGQGITSAGFHAKHLAGSTTRLSTYLQGRELSAHQLAAIAEEGEGSETAADLLAAIAFALDRYETIIRTLDPKDFGSVREVGRKRYPVPAISLAIHIVEHGQRHIGGMIAAAKMSRGPGEFTNTTISRKSA